MEVPQISQIPQTLNVKRFIPISIVTIHGNIIGVSISNLLILVQAHTKR